MARHHDSNSASRPIRDRIDFSAGNCRLTGGATAAIDTMLRFIEDAAVRYLSFNSRRQYRSASMCDFQRVVLQCEKGDLEVSKIETDTGVN